MSRESHRDRWVREVIQASSVSAEVKVFLLWLERFYMDTSGHVCERREDLSEAFGCHFRKITAKFTMAVAGGLMEQTASGGRGRTSAYRATLPGGPGGSWGASTRPPNDRLGAADYHPMEPSQGAGTRHPNDVQGASTRHPKNGPLYKDRAGAHSKRGDRNQQTPVPPGTHETAPPRTDTKVSQSARKREAFRWLHARYGLTEFEAAAVYAEVTARAPEEIRAPVRYLEKMQQGDLADIVASVFDRTAPDTESDNKPSGPLKSVGDWCRTCDERTRQIELLDGRLKRCPVCHPLRDQETA